MDMQPRYEEAEQVLSVGQMGVGQPPLAIERQSICGVAVVGLNQTTARFGTAARDVAVPSLSTATRLILNPAGGTTARQLTIELSGAQTGQITLELR